MSNVETRDDLQRLADRIANRDISWIPVSGDVVNVTLSVAERDLVVSALEEHEPIARLRAENERLRMVLKLAIEGYERVDVGHEEYRATVYNVALDALSDRATELLHDFGNSEVQT